MNPQLYSCQHKDCAKFGEVGANNLVIHSRKQERLKCKICQKTFTLSKGTGFYRLRYDPNLIKIVLILVSFGCPLGAIHQAYGIDMRTLDRWIGRFGSQCKSWHWSWIKSFFSSVRIQADELWLRLKKGKAWISTALEVSSRFWVGLEVSKRRSGLLIKRLYEQVKHSLKPQASLLIETDGFAPYGSLAPKVFRDKVVEKGHFSYRVWTDLVVIQVVKSYSQKGKKYLFEGLNKIKLAWGEWPKYGQYAKKYAIQWANTAYIERLNATLRGHLHCLVRKGRAIKENLQRVENMLWIKLVIYNYATYHRSLTCPKTKQKRTPAMVAGITKEIIALKDVFYFNKNSKKIVNFHVHT
ncbi:MAG: hypothetical protein MUE85_19035 [Microscillaceae bacterium]|jgi:IS1 family transposase|nr:hypothetical protein [Microscillaceae bacterium]